LSASSTIAERGGRWLLAPLLTWLVLSAGPRAASQQAPAADAPERVGVDQLERLDRGEDAVVVVVGGLELRRSDVFRVLDLAAPARSAEVIREMVLSTAATLEADREDIDVPADLLEREVQNAIAQQKASFALEVDETLPLEEYLEQRHGLTPEAYRTEVRRMVLSSLLLERAVRLDQLRSRRDLVAILVVEDAELAAEVGAQLREGASFAVLARRHSVHPSAERGGEVAPVPVDLRSPLYEGRQRLAPGELLGPEPLQLDGRTYWRLLRLIDRHEAETAPWEELRERVEEELRTRPPTPDELALFEARVMDRYRVTRPR
jgi:hypothetical protein